MKKLEEDLIDEKYTQIFHETDFQHHAPHLFEVRTSTNYVMAQEVDTIATIQFQEGAILECGVNGVMNEDLIAMVITRLEHFNKSEFRCHENSMAISSLEGALYWLRKRTRKREARNVEGTHTV